MSGTATSSSSYSTLPKIGPGLGSRQRIWERVQAKIFNDAYPSSSYFSTPGNGMSYGQGSKSDSIPAAQSTAGRVYPTTPYNNSNNNHLSSSVNTTNLPPSTPVASSFIPLISEKERRLLQNLANSQNLPTHSSNSKSSQFRNSNSAWLEFIPIELIDIYYAIYDEMKVLPISEKEIMKIDKDVPRTFGLFARHARHLRLNFPSDMSPYYDALKSILCAISYERGYCQGINFIVAAMLIQYPHEKQVYTILSYLLKYQYVGILFDPRYSTLLDYMRLFEKKLRKHNRSVYNHFKKCDFTTVSYAIEWFTTCFIVSSPGELSLCVLDLLIAGFDNIMIRVGLSLLDFLEEKILQLDFEGLHQKFKFLMTNADPIVIMANAIKMKLDTEVNYLQVMAQKIESMDPAQGGNLQFSRRTAISGRRYSEILISPMKIEDETVDKSESEKEETTECKEGSSKHADRNLSKSARYQLCLADDESGVPSLHKLMRIRALEKKNGKKDESQQSAKLPLLRSLRRGPGTSTKAKPSFTNQPTLNNNITPNERFLPNSPNSPMPNGEAYTYNVPMTPFAPPLYQNQFNLTSDPAMYQTTNVTQNWWNANSWKSSLINSFKGVGKLFQPMAGTAITDAAATSSNSNNGDLNLQSAVVIGSGSAVMVPPTTPPRQSNMNTTVSGVAMPPPNTVPKSTTKKPIVEDELDVESAIILSDSDFSSDLSESKLIRHRKHKRRHDHGQHGHQRFRNRKLINFLYDNLYNSINSAANANGNGNGNGNSNVTETSTSDSIAQNKISAINRCYFCGCRDDVNYFGDVDSDTGHHSESVRDQLFEGSTNIRIIRDSTIPNRNDANVNTANGSDGIVEKANDADGMDRADDEIGGDRNAYLENSMIATVLTHHLHESWFNPDGKKISKVNLRLRHFHCSKLSLSEVTKKLVKGHIQVCEEDLITI